MLDPEEPQQLLDSLCALLVEDANNYLGEVSMSEYFEMVVERHHTRVYPSGRASNEWFDERVRYLSDLLQTGFIQLEATYHSEEDFDADTD